MQQTFIVFLKRIVVFTLIIAAVEFLLAWKTDPQWISSSWPFIILFFLSFTVLLHRQLLKSTEGNPKKFVFAFLLMTTIKILLYLAVILVYVMLNRDDALGFIVAFFFNYFLFTAFELSAVMKLLKQATNKNQDSQ
jgi:hypothetical protein